jgi:hypothetical protein
MAVERVHPSRLGSGGDGRDTHAPGPRSDPHRPAGPQVVLDDVHSLVQRELPPLPSEMIEPGYPALLPIEPAAEHPVVDVQHELEVLGSFGSLVGRGAPPWVPRAKRLSSAAGHQRDRSHLVYAEHHWRVVSCARETVNPPLHASARDSRPH